MAKTAKKPPNLEPDSETLVHLKLHGNRTTMTIRIKPELKEAFTTRVRQMGLSTCHVLEGLMQGYLYCTAAPQQLVHPSPTINLTLVRDVKRLRRVYTEVEEVTETVTRENLDAGILACGFRGCHRTAVRIGVFQNQRRIGICDKCLPRVDSQNWRLEP
jgi:antitoxin component of RelBE/YafQ-DinJ toxin-antitoxin module